MERVAGFMADLWLQRRALPVLAVLLPAVASGCRTVAPSGAQTVAEPGSEVLPQGVTWAARFGIVLAGGTDGARVTDVARVSPGCVMGLASGDVITALNGVPVAGPADFEKAADMNLKTRFSPWCLEVSRGRGDRLRLPLNCDVRALRQNPLARRYLCDPADMSLCGPLTAACEDRVTP